MPPRASDIAPQRAPARPYLRDKVRGPAIERPLGKGCSHLNLRPSEVPRATLHPRFPYTKITASVAVCHALSLLGANNAASRSKIGSSITSYGNIVAA